MKNNEYEMILNEKHYPEPEDGLKGFLKSWGSFISIITLLLALRSVFIEPFKIPTGSMIPTIMIGDFILVNKLAYGLKVPFTGWFSKPVYLWQFDKPKRGEVIIFKYPKDESFDYIKRLIGEPGDKIEVINKIVYINDVPIESEEIDGSFFMEDMDEKFRNMDFKFYRNKIGSTEHVSMIDLGNHYLSDFGPHIVPEGHYLVMGDNRDLSSDSRIWGYVPFENITGRALIVWFSMSFPWPWTIGEEQTSFRPWRIGLPIK